MTVMDLEDELLKYSTRAISLYWFSDTQLHVVEGQRVTEIDVTTSEITTYHEFGQNIPPSGHATYIASEKMVLFATYDVEITNLT